MNKTIEEALKNLREVHEVQGRDGNWNHDNYMRGLYNGLELALAIIEDREPTYKEEFKIQNPVAIVYSMQDGYIGQMVVKGIPHKTKLYTHPTHTLSEDVVKEIANNIDLEENMTNMEYLLCFARAIGRAYGVEDERII
jgi:hypothetical protein